jgi:periplasmic protein TonB
MESLLKPSRSLASGRLSRRSDMRRGNMAYAQEDPGKKAAGMGMALAVNGSIIAAIMLSPLVVNRKPDRPVTHVYDVPKQRPPDNPVIEQPKDTPKIVDPIYIPPRPYTPERVKDGPTTTVIDTGTIVDTGGTLDNGKGGGGEVATREIVEVIPPAIFVGSKRDPRFARQFQPEYPSGLLVREIEGDAVLKVLVGTDGRVREAIVVRASHPDFGKAAVKQALKSWRFVPATRGGKPVEDWQTIPIRFNIDS